MVIYPVDSVIQSLNNWGLMTLHMHVDCLVFLLGSKSHSENSYHKPYSDAFYLWEAIFSFPAYWKCFKASLQRTVNTKKLIMHASISFNPAYNHLFSIGNICNVIRRHSPTRFSCFLLKSSKIPNETLYPNFKVLVLYS